MYNKLSRRVLDERVSIHLVCIYTNGSDNFLFATGWIGSVAWASNFLISPVAVLIESYIGYRLTAVLGSVSCAICYLTSSFMSNYIGVLLFMGFFCGSTSGLCIHSILCVLFKYFSSSAQTRAAGIPSAGGAMGKDINVLYVLLDSILVSLQQ